MINFRLDQPHLAVEEDFYMGYRIPKGSVLLANIWWGQNSPNRIINMADSYLNCTLFQENGT